LLAQNGLQIIDVEEVAPKGGSIRVVTQKEKGSRTISNNVKRLLKREQDAKIYSKDFFSTLKIRIEQARYVLRDYLQEIRNRNIKIIGFGASHSTTTLLYHFGLVEFIDSIIDDNPSKQNTFSPGLHIPVFNPNFIKDERSTFAILILAWQHADFIIQKHNHTFQKSYELIIPLPNLIIKKNYA
jgi:hypothetical protein